MKISPKLIARIAMLAAISIVLGKFLSIKIEPWGRLSFENMSVILCGYAFGPIAGLLCGVVADLVGCLVYGYAINPIITLGAAMIGLLSGLFGARGAFGKPRLWLSLTLSHLVGSCIIKSIGIYIFYSTPLETLALRVPMYILCGGLEYILISVILRSKGLRAVFFEFGGRQ